MIHRDIIKLNLGCGPSGIEGWVNYDWGMLPFLSKITGLRHWLIKLNILSVNYDIPWPKINLVDIRRKLPLEDGSVDYIYCSHVFEHFEKYESIKILKECFRVLRKGGVIRIVLPDLKILVNKYKTAEEFNRNFFGFEKDKKSRLNLFIRGHQWMYDEFSFTKILKRIFNGVEIRTFRQGEVPDLERLDLDIHQDHSFYIEAKK